MSTNDGLIHIYGQDAKKFLQGQLTCDLEQVQENLWLLGAHCNPKGRVISLFRIGLLNNDYYLILPSDMTDIAIKALQKYAIFFKVKLEVCPHNEIIHANIIEDKTFKLQQIERGIPTIYPQTSEKYLPHELNLPELGGVSFTKGCYTGQEIISRMQHLGKLKKKLQIMQLSKTGLTPGDDLLEGNDIIGSIVDCCEIGYNKSVVLALIDGNNP